MAGTSNQHSIDVWAVKRRVRNQIIVVQYCEPVTTLAKPILFLAFANDRDSRSRYLRNLEEEARQVQRALTAVEPRG